MINMGNNLQANQDNLQKQINVLNETKANVPKDVKKDLNYIVIVADDMGFSDLGCYGNIYINTPNLDALASQGVRCSNFLSAGVCGVSRASWNTGNCSTDTNMESNVLGNNVTLPPTESITKPLT
jgi:arylsulfatase A-like enzyme